MAKLNKPNKVQKVENHTGVLVNKATAEAELERTVLACLLWEDQFYETGESITERIQKLVHVVNPVTVADLALRARTGMKLRHVPLLLVRELARHPKLKTHPGLVTETLFAVIQRPDEITEFLSIYWKDGKTPLSAQVKKGLAKAFLKFNEYSFSKFQGNGAIKLRDAMFMVHAKPEGVNEEYTKEHRSAGMDKALNPSETLFKKITDNTLEVPDTWEVSLSSGEDKCKTFTRLMKENKLGALAFLRNLRGMLEAGVSEDLIREYGNKVRTDRVLPFRFISAATHAPRLEDMLESLMLRCLENAPKLKGRTVLVVDTSGSMGGRLSQKSELNRYAAAAALAILAREVCEDVVIYATAGNDMSRKHATVVLPPRRGFALSDMICSKEGSYNNELLIKIGGGGIFLKQCMDYIAKQEEGRTVDRVIVFTDEQDCDHGVNPATAQRLGKTNYIINVGSYQNGINSGQWTTITGFSEAVIDYIAATEALDA